MNKKRVVIIHYRIGERDGVSLEIEKRARLLQRLGAEVFFITGYDALHRKESIIVPEMDIKSNTNKFLRENFFVESILDESIITSVFHNIENRMYAALDDQIRDLKPDLVYIHNLFSLPMALPASTALLRLFDKYQPQTVAVHHDFWFEREEYVHPKFYFIKELMKTLPPTRPYIFEHVVINSLAMKDLKERRKIVPTLIGDFFDFSRPQPVDGALYDSLKHAYHLDDNDVIILQATRIVQRKAIEIALTFAHQLQKTLRKKAPITLNRKTFEKHNHVIVLFSNFVEADALDYYRQLRELAEKLGVKAIWAGERFTTERKEVDGLNRYSFWDAYTVADCITYPSVLEGFGNQFLEACFFKKLPIVFEYPVYESDIKKEGYQIISLGNAVKKTDGFYHIPDSTVHHAVDETIAIFQDPARLQRITEHNFSVAQQHHDESLLLKNLQKTLKSI